MARLDPRGAHVVVTGASRGIGRALAFEFAARGSLVTLVARSAASIAEVADAIGGRACAADLCSPDEVEHLIARIEIDAGRPVDVLVNNAAVAVVDRCVDQDPDAIRTMFALNAVAPAQLTRQVLPGMLERRRGAIVNIGSFAGITAYPTLGVYGASKAALAQYTATLQRELRQLGGDGDDGATRRGGRDRHDGGSPSVADDRGGVGPPRPRPRDAAPDPRGGGRPDRRCRRTRCPHARAPRPSGCLPRSARVAEPGQRPLAARHRLTLERLMMYRYADDALGGRHRPPHIPGNTMERTRDAIGGPA